MVNGSIYVIISIGLWKWVLKNFVAHNDIPILKGGNEWLSRCKQVGGSS